MEPLTFRMYAGVRMSRAIDPNTDFISPGGYEMIMNGKKIPFDFEIFIGGRCPIDYSLLEIELKNPMYDEYPDLNSITEDMLNNVTEITEFFVYTGEIGETDLKPISLEYVSFVLPYEWKEIEVPLEIVKAANVTF